MCMMYSLEVRYLAARMASVYSQLGSSMPRLLRHFKSPKGWALEFGGMFISQVLGVTCESCE